MTLHSDEISYKKSQTCSINFKRLFNKIIPPKTKSSKKKENLEKETVTNNENYLQFDALPDFPRRDSKLSRQSVSDSDIDNNFEEIKPETQHINNDEKPPMEEEEYENEEENFTPDENNKNDDTTRPSSYVQHTNIVVNGGTGIHFGNVYSHVHVERYTQPEKQPAGQENKMPKTEAIRELLECKDNIEVPHLNFLSSHFGTKWRLIGTSLGLTIGELDALKEKYKKSSEISFQMLKVWWQRRGEGATVGELCRKLWNGGVANAIEAVQQLSLNIEDLK